MKFSDYEASYITPQKTLLKKFNELLKFLRASNVESLTFEIPDRETLVLTSTELETIKVCDFVKFRNKVYSLTYVGDYRLVFNCASYYNGDTSTIFVLDINVSTREFELYDNLG